MTGWLEGRSALVLGVANRFSIAWGIAQALQGAGAVVGMTYAGERFERRVRPLARSLEADLLEACDVTDDSALDRLFRRVDARWGRVDVLVHSIAYAGKADLAGRFIQTSRAGFNTALEISAYSLTALAQRAEPLMGRGGAILAMTADGSNRVVPGYNVMGVAKAALEASVRYLAADLGPKGIRVNAISAGPIRTLAASGVEGFSHMSHLHQAVSPLRSLVNIDDVGRAAVWLCSDRAGAVTGQIVYVDSGWHIIGLPAEAD